MYFLPKPKKLTETNGEFFAESGLRIVSESEGLKTSTGWALPKVLRDELLRYREFDNLIRYEVHQSQIWLIFFVKS